MATPIGILFFNLGDWDHDCTKGKSVVTAPPPDPVIGDPGNTVTITVRLGGGLLAWGLNKMTSAFSGDSGKTQSGSDRMKKQLEKTGAFTGGVRAHFYAAGYATPCDPTTRKRVVGWKWYIHLTMSASADLVAAGGDATATTVLGPFDGEEDPPCDCDPAAAVSMIQLHDLGGSVVAMTAPVGTSLIRDGIALPAAAVDCPSCADGSGPVLIAALVAKRPLAPVWDEAPMPPDASMQADGGDAGASYIESPAAPSGARKAPAKKATKRTAAKPRARGPGPGRARGK